MAVEKFEEQNTTKEEKHSGTLVFSVVGDTEYNTPFAVILVDGVPDSLDMTKPEGVGDEDWAEATAEMRRRYGF
jgi:hypothetical protein